MRGSIARCFRLVTEASEKNRNRHEEILPVPENLPFIAFLPPDISAGFFFCGLMPLRANLRPLRTFAAAFCRFYYQNRAATRRFTSAPSALPLTLGISSFIMRPLSCGAGFSMPREASEMFHSANSVQNPAFRGLWIHSLKTSDKVLKYGENNKVDFSEHPTVVKRGSVRTINIYAAVPDVA